MHFAGGDLFLRCAFIAQLANAQLTFRCDRRSKNTAGDGAGSVEFAGSGCRVQSGTRLVVGKIIPTLRGFLRFIEQAGSRIARQLRGQPCDRLARALPHPGGALWSLQFEFHEAITQAQSVQLIDGEHSDATLRASRAADQPFTASTRRIRKSRVDDLDQRLISGRGGVTMHVLRVNHKGCTVHPGSLGKSKGGRGDLRARQRFAPESPNGLLLVPWNFPAAVAFCCTSRRYPVLTASGT